MMKRLTVREIIKFGIKIEKESFRFYRNASKKIEDNETKSLTDDLADQEIEHLNKLQILLNEDIVTTAELNETVETDDILSESIVKTSAIKKGAGSIDILAIALKREKNTKENYERFLKLTPMNEQIADAFKELREMEEKHVQIIAEKINSIKKNN